MCPISLMNSLGGGLLLLRPELWPLGNQGALKCPPVTGSVFPDLYFNQAFSCILRVQIWKHVPAGVEMVIARDRISPYFNFQNDSFVFACLPITCHCTT